MKLTSPSTFSRKGMTLLEVTIVILVLLSLIFILFVGARAWMNGSNRSGCILNIRNAQNAVRAYQNVRGVPEGADIDMFTDIIGAGKFLEVAPECPGGGGYEYIEFVPYEGELAVTCSLAASQDHYPKSGGDW